jgi:hypothetical protein
MSTDKEIKGLQETVQAYLDAIKTGKDEFFERAFYPFAYVIPAGENPINSKIPIKDFIKRIKKRHVEGTKTEEIALGITYSYQGRVANIKLDFKLIIGDSVLYGSDYFNMIKYSDKWKISQKIYDVTLTE